MRKFLNTILAIILLFPSYSFAAGKGSSGGKSYSSGGRSYSSGGSSFSKPSISVPKSPSISVSKTPTPSKPPSYSSGGGKSYSSSGTSNPSSVSKSYSSGSNTSSTYSKKPTDSFQSLAAAEQKKVEARSAYRAATVPKETYTTPKGETKKIDPTDKRVEQIRKDYTSNESKWVTRQDREKSVFGDYYHKPQPTIVYNDPYPVNIFFWMWLLDRNKSVDDRASWAYHHKGDIDQKRYDDMLANDVALKKRIEELEKEKKDRDVTFVPKGIDPDLQYTESFGDSIENPVPKYEYKPVNWGGFFHGVWVFIKWVFYILAFILVSLLGYWFFFEKRW